MLGVTHLAGFGVVGSPLTETIVGAGVGTVIGDLTGGASQSNCFDGNTNQPVGGAATCPFHNANPGYIGKQFSSGKIISKVVAYGGSDAGFVFGVNGSTTVKIYAKNTAPSNGTDGTEIGTTTFTDTADATTRTITSTDTSNAWIYVWIYINGGGGNSACCAEMEIYELA